jgi:hypothetical protein
MPINTTDLSDIPPDLVAASEEILKQLLLEEFPDLDLSKGTVFQQFILQTNAIFDSLSRTDQDRLRRSQSLQAINEDPTLADDDIVDRVLSNFQINRREASAANGTVTIVVSDNVPVTISATTSFTDAATNRVFNPTASFVAYADVSQVVNEADRLLQLRADGNYSFTIDVAETVDAGAAVDSGTQFTVAPVVPNLVQAFASEIQAGLPEETNEELVARLDDGISARSAADRLSIAALITDQFPDVLDMSIIGFGDEEMQRDKHNIFGIAHGGKADIYVRTQQATSTQALIYRATPQGKDAASTTQFDIVLNPDLPEAFYAVEAVTPADPAETRQDLVAFGEINARPSRAIDEEFTPFIGEDIEAVYSRYQGAVTVRTSDPDAQADHKAAVLANLGDADNIVYYVGGTAFSADPDTIAGLIDQGFRFYTAYSSYIGQINEIQDYINLRENRAPGADFLVKAPNPVTTSLSLVVEYERSAPDVTDLVEAIARAVNTLPIEQGTLTASMIVAAAQPVLGDTARIKLPFNFMRGRLRKPDGSIVVLDDLFKLVIPSDPSQGVSSRTSAFFLRPENIAISLSEIASVNT